MLLEIDHRRQYNYALLVISDEVLNEPSAIKWKPAAALAAVTYTLQLYNSSLSNRHHRLENNNNIIQ